MTSTVNQSDGSADVDVDAVVVVVVAVGNVVDVETCWPAKKPNFLGANFSSFFSIGNWWTNL